MQVRARPGEGPHGPAPGAGAPGRPPRARRGANDVRPPSRAYTGLHPHAYRKAPDWGSAAAPAVAMLAALCPLEAPIRALARWNTDADAPTRARARDPTHTTLVLDVCVVVPACLRHSGTPTQTVTHEPRSHATLV